MAHQLTESASLELLAVLDGANIPAMPDCAMRVLAVSNDPNKDAIDLAKPIEADAGMAAQLLRFVNSSYFGFRQKIGSVPQAVAMLGIAKVANFVMWNAVFSVTPDPNCRGLSMPVFRCDALRRGLFARALSVRLGAGPQESDVAFTSGLLQDIALPVLVGRLGEAYLELLDRCQREEACLSQRESEAWGWTHAEAACVLLEHWKLPTNIVEPVRSHCDPESLLGQAQAPAIATAVAISSLIPGRGDMVWRNIDRFQACWERLPNASATPLPQLLAEVDTAFADLSRALNVGAGGASLAVLHADALAACVS